jgi:lipoprotein-anchoring transpeptidase ErfK/SrfK
MIRITEPYLHVSIATQTLSLIAGGETIIRYPVSTARNGPGEIKGSECTPTGWHRIRAKIGNGFPIYTVFKARRPTGEIYDSELAARFPERDWILTRILWLDGLQPCINRYGSVGTGSRYVYIHGSPDNLITGVPSSHGCIRMRNSDVIDLFNQVSPGCRILIDK